MLSVVLFAAIQTAVPTASPSPSPAPRFRLRAIGSNVFVDQATGGPGTVPPQGAAFANGSPVSPMSPYDWFTGAPVTPGVAGIAQYVLSGTFDAGGMTIGAKLGVGALTGSTTNAAYWGEPLIPNLNPHALSRIVPYAIVFPQHAGLDDASVFNASLLQASVGGPSHSWRVRGGYFALRQTDRFVFAPPPLTSVTPSLGSATAETLGPGMPSIGAWSSSPSALPLLGLDGYAKRGPVSMELTDALLPSPAGTTARLTMGSVVLNHSGTGRLSVQLAHVGTSGDPIETTTYYGVNPQTYPGAQGRLFTSTLADQRETIAGARASFHPLPHWDVLAELGRSWYDAGLVARPGTQHLGNYEHVLVARHFGGDTVTLEYHRFDPTYATIILPYGVPENIWSVAWSWPGVWLKSTYQMVDNSIVGANRAGFHLRYDHPGGALEVHLGFGDWRQIAPETVANASQVGFVDGFFLLQRNAFATIGTDRQVAGYVAWHLPHDDLTLDAVEDYLQRPADPAQPIDTVAIRAPEVVASLQHHVSKALIAVAGYGRYEAAGTWATTTVDATYGVGFAGVEFATGPSTALLVEARRYALAGLPAAPNSLSPAMHGTALIVDQRVSL
jgi:hypothetical protein